MADSPDELQAQLQNLYKGYAAKLPAKVAEIETAWLEARSKQWEAGSLKAAHRLIHTLAGSAGTYGYPNVGKIARKIEIVMKSLPGSAPALAQENEIDNLLIELRALALNPDQDNTAFVLEELASLDDYSLPLPPTKNVFLLESDSSLARDLALQIGYFGYKVHIYRTLEQVKQAIKQQVPATLLVDVAETGNYLSEIEAIAEIQKGYSKPIPIIFISVRGDLIARLQAVRAGGRAYFTKPLDTSALIDQLDIITTPQSSEPYRILIIDDAIELASHYALTLQRVGMVTTIVTNPLNVMSALVESVPDLILLDVYMPDCTGTELAAVIRQQPAYVSIPIVFLSTETDLEQQMAVMQLGGDDFLTKPIQPNYLIASVTARAQRSRTLRSFIVRDGLTGLFNHTKTKEFLDVEVARAQRHNGRLSLAIIDLDHFKNVNDTYGHLSGDRVLKSLARLLQQRLRRTDIIGRYGGEEFAIILPDTDGQVAVQVLDEVRLRFGQVRQQSETQEFRVTFSCGIASFPAYEDPVALTSAADKALYKAKELGRNRVILADSSEL